MDSALVTTVAALTLAMSSSLSAAQETMDFKPYDPKEFQRLLRNQLGSKSEGVIVNQVTAFTSVPGDVEKAVTTITEATDYIAASLCPRKSRPTKITLHLTAGFDLVFSGETGSQIEWDLELVCPRWEK